MWGGARLTDLRRKPTKHCTIPEVNNFMKISEILTSENLQTLISLLEVSPASRSRSAEQEKALPTSEEICSLSLPDCLKRKDLSIFALKTYPVSWGLTREKTFAKIIETLSQLGYCVEWRVYNSADYLPQVRKRVYIAGCLGIDCSGKILAFGKSDSQNCRKTEQIIGGSQGTRVYDPDGLAVTQCSGSGGMGGKTGLYFIDSNPPPNLTENARCITARQNSGVSHHKGEHSAVFCDLNENPQITENARCLHTRMDLGVTNGTHKGERSGVLIEDGPRAIINPFKETIRQNGRRIKNPNEPMFTLTVTDRHGIVHHGRIRRLMPIEAWRLQGFTTEQFEKVAATGMSDAQLYKQAGNAVSVPVVEEIARNLLKFDEEIN